MALQEQFERDGNWLFRWRSYPPALIVALALLFIGQFKYPGGDHTLDLLWEALCMAVALFGLGVRSYAVGYAGRATSGRNTGKQLAGVLNTTGIYSIVRHPLYLGNFFIWLGLSMFIRSGWFCLIVALLFWIYYERIMFAEEAFLRGRFGDEFTEWAETTPAFIPRFANWKPNIKPFSFKTVLRREQSGLLGIVVTFAFLEAVGDYVVDGRLELDPAWIIVLAAGLLIFCVLTALKKTRVI